MTLYIDTKPTLEWKRPPANTGYMRNTEVWTALTSHFNYEVHTVNLNTYQTDYVYMLYRERIITNVTLSEAKAAAQADYERRMAERFVKVEIDPIADLSYLKDLKHHLAQNQYELVDELLDDWIEELEAAITKANEKS